MKEDLKEAGFPTLYNSFTPASFALDQTTLFDWIESRVPGGHGSRMGQLLDVAYNIEYGAETTDQSALNLIYLLAYQPIPGNLCGAALAIETGADFAIGRTRDCFRREPPWDAGVLTVRCRAILFATQSRPSPSIS